MPRSFDTSTPEGSGRARARRAASSTSTRSRSTGVAGGHAEDATFRPFRTGGDVNALPRLRGDLTRPGEKRRRDDRPGADDRHAVGGTERCHCGVPFARNRGHVDRAAQSRARACAAVGSAACGRPPPAPRPRRASSRPGPPRARHARQSGAPPASRTAAPRQTDRWKVKQRADQVPRRHRERAGRAEPGADRSPVPLRPRTGRAGGVRARGRRRPRPRQRP